MALPALLLPPRYVLPTEGGPSGRMGGSCVAVGRGALFFGGADPSQGTFDDVHALEFDEFSWTRIAAAGPVALVRYYSCPEA